MLNIKNITKSYDDIVILNDISYTFQDTGFYVLYGENGSGKSTLLSILSGKDIDHQGEVYVNDTLLNKKNADYYSSNYITYLTQDSLIFEEESVLNNVLLPFHKKDKKKAMEILSSLGLENVIHQKAETLSAGEKQRVAFARALYDVKDIILVDELTSNLDNESANKILDELMKLSQDHLVIMVTHENIIDHDKDAYILHLENGKMIEERKGISKSLEGKRKAFKPSFFSALMNQVKEEKGTHIFLSLITIIFVTLIIAFSSFTYSFEYVSVYDEKTNTSEVIKNRQDDLT